MEPAVIRILILHDSPEDFRDWLTPRCEGCSLFWAGSPDEVTPMLEEARPEVVFSIKHSEFPGEAHRPAVEFPSVRWFHVGGSGYEHLGRWDAGRVQVTNSAGVLAPFHAERAMAALLALSTGLVELGRRQARSEWAPTRFETLLDKTLLVVGLGATGTELARRARAFGMRVIGVSRSARQVAGADEVYPLSELERLWGLADVVSLNVPLTEETRSLVDRQVLERLRPGCLLLNGSRGGVVVEEALVSALREGGLAGAWLDVFATEPLPPDSPLWSLPRVIVTPHCADQVADFPLRFARFFWENLVRYQTGRALRRRVFYRGG